MVDWQRPKKRLAIWRRWPAYGGSGVIALPPDDALYHARLGTIKIDGCEATVCGVDAIDSLDDRISLYIMFKEGEWTKPHPA